MDNTGRRLGVAMLTVVVMLALNAVAVLSGNADGAYALLFGEQPHSHMATVHIDQAAPVVASSPAECVKSRPKPAAQPALLPVALEVTEPAAPARMC